MKAVVNLVLLGKGNVGEVWLELFPQIQATLKDIAEVRLVAVANSTKVLSNWNGLSGQQIAGFAEKSSPSNLHALISALGDAGLTNVVFVDVTASEQVANAYIDIAQRGWNLISANKLPLTTSSERYTLLVDELKKHNSFWGINATVGAALPVQASLQELLHAGDQLHQLEGVFSGSLSYLLTTYDGQQSFTDLVADARELGFTEPDPREDLSGADVSRKLLILSRLAGYQLEINQIETAPLLPAHLMAGSVEDFWSNKAEIDSFMAQQFAQAQQQGKKLVYKAQAKFMNKVVAGQVALSQEDEGSPVAQLTPTDNIFVFNTDFYQQNPLVVRGPGAGAVVTATAVNIDLNKFVVQAALQK